jgi:cation diffusion facilitator family transporter
MRFPDPISLPESVVREREQRKRQIINASWWGVGIRFSIILFELIGVYLFASASLLLDAVSSLIDVLSSLSLIFFIRLAEKPPDKDHPFGHGRYEPLIGMLLGLILAIIGASLFMQQLLHLSTEPIALQMDKRAWLIPFFAVILLEIGYRSVMYTAKKQNSPALAADAVHYRIDGITSLLATIALIFAAYVPSWSLAFDHLGAIFIALLMMCLGFYAAKSNFNQLMDRTPDPKFFQKTREAALRVEGVKGTEKIRIQLFGPDAHVDIDIEVDPQLSVEAAHVISQRVRAEIQKDWPAVRDVMVHIEPFYPGDHE